MASIDVKEILHLTPQLLNIPSKRVWYSYDDEADVLYLGGDKGTGPLSQKHGGVVSCVFIGYTQKRKFYLLPQNRFFVQIWGQYHKRSISPRQAPRVVFSGNRGKIMHILFLSYLENIFDFDSEEKLLNALKEN